MPNQVQYLKREFSVFVFFIIVKYYALSKFKHVCLMLKIMKVNSNLKEHKSVSKPTLIVFSTEIKLLYIFIFKKMIIFFEVSSMHSFL